MIQFKKSSKFSIMVIGLFFMLAYTLSGQVKGDNPFNNIKLNLFLSAAYEYNFNNPSDMKNSLRIFDYDHNSFKMDEMQISIHQDSDKDTPYGFRSDILAGSSIPKIVRSAGMDSGDIDILQMYAYYIIPLGNGLRIDFGKFATHLGFEVVEGWDNYNDNYSRSFGFGYSVPFTHTGMKLSYSFGERASLMLMVVNGWDNAVDNNKSKSAGGQLFISPFEGLNIYANYLTGPEQDNNNSNYRSIYDLAASYTTGRLFIGVSANYAAEDFSSPKSFRANWSSIAGYIKFNFSTLFSLAVRGEIFSDTDGVRTGIIQELREITVTPCLNLSDHFLVRGEWRYDTSGKDVFTYENRLSDFQSTAALNFIYHF